MTGRRSYVVALLSGHGTGAEVTAEASRALTEVARLHGFEIVETHPVFAGEAVPRSGEALPLTTRDATHDADAVLVAAGVGAALQVAGEPGPATTVSWTLLDDGTKLAVFAPGDDDGRSTVERALAAAAASTGELVSVAIDPSWQALVESVAATGPVSVRHLALAEAAHVLSTDPGSLGVVVTERQLAAAVAGIPHAGTSRHLAASGLLSPSGPGLFAPGPAHGPAPDANTEEAGMGVANPSEMLLATALLLAEGLDRRAAAETLAGGLAGALRRPQRTPDVAGAGVAATTREFADVVLDLLPSARQDTEFAIGGMP